MVKAVTEAGLKFWIIELLNEDPKRSWPELEKFFLKEFKQGRITLFHVNQARQIYRRLRSVYRPVELTSVKLTRQEDREYR